MTLSTVTSIAELRLLPAAYLQEGMQVQVDNYAKDGDNGGGLFTWNAASWIPDDGGINIAPGSYLIAQSGIVIATANGTATSFSYNAGNGIWPNSVSITAGAVTATDNGAGLIAGAGAVGGVTYTGAIKINFTTPPANGTQILLNYNEVYPSGRWTRQFTGSVHSSWFNALSDGVTDAAAALNAGIYYCIQNSKTFELDGLSYLINHPLIAFGYAYSSAGLISLSIKGQKAFDVTSSPQTHPPLFGTQILCNFNNSFALCVQGLVGSHIADIVFIGQNNYIAGIYSNINAGALSNAATFVVNGCRDSVDSPYAGIVIDPFTSSLPADGGYPGYADFYGAFDTTATATGDLTLERVNCSDFVVGLMVAPTNLASNNTTNITCRDCIISYNKVNVAIGGSEARNLYWYGGSAAYAYTCFDGMSYGNGNGCSFKIFGGYLGYAKYLFAYSAQAASNFYCSAAHGENFESIGFFGQNSNASIVDAGFYGCEFYPWLFGNIAAAPIWLYTTVNVSFNDCFFASGVSYLANGHRQFPYRIISDQAPAAVGTSIVTFRNCVFNFGFGDFSVAPSFNLAGEIIISDCLRFYNCINNDQGGTYNNNNNNSTLTDSIIATVPSDYISYLMPVGATLMVNAAGSEGVVQKNFSLDADRLLALGSLTVTVSSDPSQATLSYPNYGVIRVGDLIYTTTPVTTPNSPTTTFSNNLTCLGIVTRVASTINIQGVPQNLPSGTYTLYSYWWARYSTPTLATTTSGSNTITITSGGSWKASRKINGAGIQPGTYVTNVVGSTYTLSATATATATGVRVYDANMYKFTGTPV